MSALTYKSGFAANPQGGIQVLTVVLDATNADGKGNGVTFGAGDTVSILLPAGTQILNALCRTDVAWTGTVSAGITGATTAVMSTVTPSATVGAVITAQAALNTTTVSVCALDSVTYLVLTVTSANTTGKLFFSFLCHALKAV